jgi:hypothetical protein
MRPYKAAQEAQAQLDAACAKFNHIANTNHTEDEYMKAVEEMADADEAVYRAQRRLALEASTTPSRRSKDLAP